MTTYVSSAAVRAALRAAQERLDRHAACDLSGRCIACGKAEPCPDRLTALRVFARHGRLPHRRRGASLLGLIAPPPSWSGWLLGADGDGTQVPTGGS